MNDVPHEMVNTSVKRIHRLLKILQSLESERGYRAVDLAEICGVSRRTIFRDLSALRDAGLALRYDDGHEGYHLPRSFDAIRAELSTDEAAAMYLLCHVFGSTKSGLPFVKTAREGAGKLIANLPERLRRELAAVREAVSVDWGPPWPQQPRCHEAISGAILKSIRNRYCLRIRYADRPVDSPPQTLLSPYRLLLRGGCWYVVGRSSRHAAVRTFRLSSICQIEHTDYSYQIPKRFRLSRYFGNAWLMEPDRTSRTAVRIQFDPSVAHKVAGARWHRSQEVTWNDDGSLDFRVEVDGLEEIAGWILSFGPNAEVLQPRRLRQRIAETCRQMAKRYG